MHEEITGLLLRIGHAHLDARADQQTDIADLAAGLAVERRLVQYDRTTLAGLEAIDLDTVLDQRRDHAFRALGLVTEEFGGTELLAQRKPDVLGRSFAGARP